MLANQIKPLVKCKTAMAINPIAMPTSLSSLVKRRKKYWYSIVIYITIDILFFRLAVLSFTAVEEQQELEIRVSHV